LKIWIALEAGHRLLEDKRAGALELLLTTPLNGMQILGGQLLALRRQFLWPLLLVVLVELLMMGHLAQGSEAPRVIGLWLAGIGMLLFDIAALVFTSMAAALSGKSLHKANLGTLFCVLVLPWIGFAIIALGASVWTFLFSAIPQSLSWKFYLPLWFVLGLAFDALFGWRSFHLLRTRFHELAGRQEETSDVWTAPKPRRAKGKQAGAAVEQVASEQAAPVVAEPKPKRRKKRLITVCALILVTIVAALCYGITEPSPPPPVIVHLANNNAPLKVFPNRFGVLIIPPDGSLWHWGQTANRSQPLAEVPVRIGTGTNWASAAGEASHWLALQNDGTLWEWGRRWQTNLGVTPEQVGTDTNWTKISAGHRHSAALRNDGTLWAWGDNSYAQLGVAVGPHQPVPIQIGTDSNWSDIDAQGLATFGLRRDGTLWVWGLVPTRTGNSYQQLNLPTPTRFNNDTNWVELVSSSGLVKNRQGELWHPDGVPAENTPAKDNCTRFISISVKGSFATGMLTKPELTLGGFQVRENGALWATPVSWNFGQTPTKENWQQFGERSDWVTVWGSGATIVGLTSDNTLWTWGPDLGKSPVPDFGTRVQQLKAGIMGILGQPNRNNTSGSSQPIQKEPRPLMVFERP